MANRCDVDALKSFAKSKYEKSVGSSWNNADLVASLQLLYEETTESDRLLKDVAITADGGNVKVLVDRGEFATMCKSNGEIAYDVLRASLVAVIKPCEESENRRQYFH